MASCCDDILRLQLIGDMVGDVGIGVDVADVSRFADMRRGRDDILLSHIFTDEELDYCYGYDEPAQHLAVRYACKEAVVKGLAYFDVGPLEYNSIVVEKMRSGCVTVSIRDDDLRSRFDVKASLSHCRDKAMAFVLVLNKGTGE